MTIKFYRTTYKRTIPSLFANNPSKGSWKDGRIGYRYINSRRELNVMGFFPPIFPAADWFSRGKSLFLFPFWLSWLKKLELFWGNFQDLRWPYHSLIAASVSIDEKKKKTLVNSNILWRPIKSGLKNFDCWRKLRNFLETFEAPSNSCSMVKVSILI